MDEKAIQHAGQFIFRGFQTMRNMVGCCYRALLIAVTA